VDGLWPFLRSRHALRKRARRHADQPATAQDVERAGALADQMCRWLETGARVHPATGEKRHRRGIEVPADAFGEVACLLVFRDQADERAGEVGVQRRQQERQDRLRDACVGREGVREGAEAVGARERLDETGQG
jgi:hypothetical protein